LLFLGAVHAAGGGVGAAVRAVVPAFLVDLPLAILVVPIVRWFLRHPSLRLQRARLPVLPGEFR
jgi:hypothetical protein